MTPEPQRITRDAHAPRLTRLDGYVRVSRVAGREGESFQSPTQQRDVITSWAKMRGVEIAAWHEDLDVSGGTLIRPELEACLARIRSGETGGIVVSKLDRLSRAGVADALKLVEEIRAHGGVIAAPDLGIDPTTPFGEFALTLLLALARMERVRLMESWKAAKSRALDRGAKIGPTPYGYTRGIAGRLEIDPERAPVVREAFSRAKGGITPAVDFLRENALGRVWTPFTTRRFLANRTYVGELCHDGETRYGLIEPIVTVAAWQRAQHEQSERRRPAAAFPLSGLASCATCGAHMVGARGGGAHGAPSIRTYRCSGSINTKRTGVRCPAPALMTAGRLEGEVDRVIRDNAHTFGLALGIGEEAIELESVEVELWEAEHELSVFAADVNARRLLGDGWTPALEARSLAVELAKDAYRAASSSAARGERLVDGHDRLDAMTPAEWGQLVRDAIERVEVVKGRGPVEGRVRVFLR